MVDTAEDDLICDLAECYHVMDYKALPLRTVATLAFGLPADSRVKGKISGLKMQPMVGLTLVQILDSINNLAWAIGGGKEKPKLAIDMYYKAPEEKRKTGADFERARAELLRKIHGK